MALAAGWCGRAVDAAGGSWYDAGRARERASARLRAMNGKGWASVYEQDPAHV